MPATSSSSTGGTSPVLASKLTPPSLPEGTVVRPRLTSAMSGQVRVVLVVAPPGFGKTAAVRQLIERSPVPVAWLSVDLLDESADSFWLHFLRALRTALPSIDDEPELLLGERGARDPLFLAVLMAQIERDATPLTVVLDDLARVTRRSVLVGLTLLVDRIGHLVRFVVTARSDPALPIARWRSAGWVVEVREDDLRFADDEALALAATFGDVPMGDDAVLALHRRTDGWPIGLHLALMSVRGAADSARAAEALARSDRILSDYLVAEVLDQLPSEQREVALMLSVVEWFDPELCRDLVGEHAGRIVHDLQRRRMLLTVIDERHGALRFHALFRGLLEQELRWRDPERHRALHRRAAQLRQERGELNLAYRHLMAIDDAQAASRLVVEPALALVDTADHVGLARLMTTLPRALEVDEPSMALDLALAWFFAGHGREAASWCDRAEDLLARDDPAARLRIHALRCLLALMEGDLVLADQHVAGYEALAARVDVRSPMESRFATIAARVTLVSGNVTGARTWVARAASMAGPEAWVSVTVRAMEAWLHLSLGRLDRASELADEACQRVEDTGMRPHHGAFDAMVVGAWCALGRGDLAEADRLSDGARADGDALGFAWNRLRAGLVVAELRRVQGTPDASLAIVRQLERLFEDDLHNTLARDLLTAEAAALLDSGRVDEAGSVTERLADGPTRRLLLARAASIAGDAAGVESLLDRRHDWTVPEQLEAEVLVASSSDPTTAEALMASALRDGAATGWVSPFLGHGKALGELFRRLPVHLLHPRLAAALRPSALDGARRPHVEQLTPRELTILELLPTHLAYREIGERLHLSVNTVKSSLKSIYRKLDATSRATAVEAAYRSGLL